MHAAKLEDHAHRGSRHRESRRVARKTNLLVHKMCDAQRAWLAEEADLMAPDEEGPRDDSTLTVTKELFLLAIQQPEIHALLDELDVPPDRADLFDALDADGSGGLEVFELIQGLLRVRGEARKADIIASRLAIRDVQLNLKNFEAKVLANQNSMLAMAMFDPLPRGATAGLDVSTTPAGASRFSR